MGLINPSCALFWLVLKFWPSSKPRISSLWVRVPKREEVLGLQAGQLCHRWFLQSQTLAALQRKALVSHTWVPLHQSVPFSSTILTANWVCLMSSNMAAVMVKTIRSCVSRLLDQMEWVALCCLHKGWNRLREGVEEVSRRAQHTWRLRGASTTLICKEGG